MTLNADWHDDPVAKRVSWKPLIDGGFSFCRHRMYKRGSRLSTYVTGFTQQFCAAFIFVSIFFPTAMLIFWFNFTPEDPSFFGTIFLLAFMVFFTGVSAWLTRFLHRKCLCFDRDNIRNFRGVVCRTADVHAVQLLSETVVWTDTALSFNSHEVNLVLKDGSRINVFDHAMEDIIRHDARLLSKYLGVPVWDALRIFMK